MAKTTFWPQPSSQQSNWSQILSVEISALLVAFLLYPVDPGVNIQALYFVIKILAGRVKASGRLVIFLADKNDIIPYNVDNPLQGGI